MKNKTEALFLLHNLSSPTKKKSTKYERQKREDKDKLNVNVHVPD